MYHVLPALWLQYFIEIPKINKNYFHKLHKLIGLKIYMEASLRQKYLFRLYKNQINFWIRKAVLSLNRLVARFSMLSHGICHRKVPYFAQIITGEYFYQNTSIKPCNILPPMFHIKLHLNATIIRKRRSGIETNSNNFSNMKDTSIFLLRIRSFNRPKAEKQIFGQNLNNLNVVHSG